MDDLAGMLEEALHEFHAGSVAEHSLLAAVTEIQETFFLAQPGAMLTNLSVEWPFSQMDLFAPF